jgi:hypothetical protein
MCAFRADFANHEVLKVRKELVTGVLTGNSVALGATSFFGTDYSSFAEVPVAVVGRSAILFWIDGDVVVSSTWFKKIDFFPCFFNKALIKWLDGNMDKKSLQTASL